MRWFSGAVALVAAGLRAIAELFRWLNTKREIDEDHERKRRIGQMQRAAARPSRSNADRLNRWLHRGRAGRLRDRDAS